jgi:ribosomal-protein-serine acetyltransferase
VLSPASPKCAAESFAVVDRERDRLREWLPWVDQTTSVKDTRRYYESVERLDSAGDGVHAVIRLNDVLVGHADLRLNPPHPNGEVGYWLSESAVGRGLMTRVVAELLDIGFRDFGLHRIQLQAATENTRSRAVAERLGMVYEGLRREAEQVAAGFVDLAVYAVLVHEWPGAEVVLDRLNAQLGPAR